MADYREGLSLLPEHMREGVTLYIEHGLPRIGSFLRNVLCNRLVDSHQYADADNAASLREWALFLYNYAPQASWGSDEKVDAWIAAGGLHGRPDEATP